MRRQKFGSCLVLLAAFWFAGNSGLLVAVPPCPMHGNLVLGGPAMPMGHSDSEHLAGSSGGSQHSQHTNGCDCGGRCGTATAQFVLPPAVTVAIPVFAAESTPDVLIPRGPTPRFVHLPPATGPPTTLA